VTGSNNKHLGNYADKKEQLLQLYKLRNKIGLLVDTLMSHGAKLFLV
jgi:hypothetical protein